MKIAVVYNRESANVINLFGVRNREKIGMKTVNRLTAALKDNGHQVIALEGDKDLVERLEEFMPRFVKGERPGLVGKAGVGLRLPAAGLVLGELDADPVLLEQAQGGHPDLWVELVHVARNEEGDGDHGSGSVKKRSRVGRRTRSPRISR